MSEVTTKLGLVLPGGGSSGAIQPDEIADVDVLNNDFKKLEAAVGAQQVTSTTRPASPYAGKLIYESDTKNLLNYNGTRWAPIGIPNCPSVAYRTALFPNPDQGDTCKRTDQRFLTEYRGTSWRPIGVQDAANDATGQGYFTPPVDGDRYYDLAKNRPMEYYDATRALTAGWYPANVSDVKVIVGKSSAQNLSANFTPIAFNTELFKSVARMHSTTSNTSRLVADNDGIWRLHAKIWVNVSSGSVVGSYRINGGAALPNRAAMTAALGIGGYIEFEEYLILGSGTYVEVLAAAGVTSALAPDGRTQASLELVGTRPPA